MDLRPELTLSRWENVCRSPGIVLALVGYILAGALCPVIQIAWTAVPSEYPFPKGFFSPVFAFCAVWGIKLILKSDRREIWALRMFLVLGAVSIGVGDVFGKINFSSFVENNPRMAFSGFVSTLVIASSHTMMMLVWLALLSAPSVRRWVHSGVRTNEGALELLLEKRKRAEGNLSSLIESGKIKQDSSFKGRFKKRKLIRVCSYLVPERKLSNF